MKKTLIIILLAAVLLLSGCRIEYVITDETTGGTVTEEQTGKTDLINWDIPKCLSYVLDIEQAAVTPRGLVFESGLPRCYSPVTGEVTYLCGDPLCSHDMLGDCPFRYSYTWAQLPVSDGKRLYFFDRVVDIETGDTEKYVISETDLYGMDKKTVYETPNGMNMMFITEDALYFDEFASSAGAVIKRYDLKTGKITSPKINSEDGLISKGAFLPVDGRICYEYDGALYRCDADFTKSEKVRDDYSYKTLFTDGTYLYHAVATEGIFRTDPETGETEPVYSLPEGMWFYESRISDRGIIFTLRYADKVPRTKNYEEWKSAFPDGSLYLYDFSDGQCKRIDMGEFYAYYYLLSGDTLYFQECVQGSDSRATYGNWYKAVIDTSSDVVSATPEMILEVKNYGF